MGDGQALRHRCLAIVVLLSSGPAMALMFSALGPALPMIAAHFPTQGGTTGAQMIMSTPGIGVVAGGLASGFAIERLGVRAVLFAALLLYALAGAAGLVVDDLWALLAARFVLGVTAAHISAAVLTLVGAWFSEAERARILGFQAGVAGVVSVAMLLLGGRLAEFGGWRAPFALYLAALPVLAIALLAIPPAAAPKTQAERTDWPAILQLWLIYLLVLGLFLAYFMTSIQLTFLLAQDGVASAITRSYVIGAGVAAGGLAGGCFGPLYRRIGRRAIRIAIIVAMAAGFLVIGLSHNLLLIAAGAVLCGGAGGLINPYVSGLVLARASADMRARALGFMIMTFYVADFLNPWAVYPVRVTLGIHAAFLVAAGLLVAALLASWRVGARVALTASLIVAMGWAATAAAAVPADGATEGKVVYAQFCATCHGSALRGGGSPPLTGSTFIAKWSGRPAQDLHNLIADTMPKGSTGTLTAAQIQQVFAYVLEANGFSADSSTLTRDPNAKVEAEPPEPVLPKLVQSAVHATAPGPTDADLAAAADGSWLTYNRDYQGRRFANLTQITPDNVKHLAPVCIFQPGEPGSFEASPIVDGDRLYVTTTHNTYAVNAANCHKLWQYNYMPPGAEGLPVNRGVALYRGKVLRGTADGHVIALDAATGALLWDVWVANAARGYNINGAPAVLGGKVFVGEGGADRGATGHVYAFDVETGALAWTFDTVPTSNQPGAETWGNGSAVGGGSSWTAFTLDPAERALYVPVGNPGADMDGSLRPGANLYTDSIVVLDADTGKLKWYIQQIPHDTHDWDTAAAPVLYDLGGRKYMAVASKDGWLYLYDRDTKALLARSETTTHVNADTPMKPGDVLRVCPSTLGGAEWNGPAFDPKRRMLFVNTVDWCGTFRIERSAGSTFGGGLDFDPFDKVSGWVRGFDAATGQEKWRIHADGPMVAGLTPTASGLVFTGTPTGEFWALSAATGDIVYRFYTGGAIAGGISTYQVNGKQYVAVTSGSASQTIWHSAGTPTLIVFALPAARS
jgi:PQQ-dependent dehydrogenase (methanol/ethanol family)